MHSKGLFSIFLRWLRGVEGFCSMCRFCCSIIGCVRASCDGDTVVENKYHLVEKRCIEKRPKMVYETIEGLWDL